MHLTNRFNEKVTLHPCGFRKYSVDIDGKPCDIVRIVKGPEGPPYAVDFPGGPYLQIGLELPNGETILRFSSKLPLIIHTDGREVNKTFGRT